MSRDEREWILRWDHRSHRHYIDGPTHGEFEGITVVPKTVLEAVELDLAEAKRVSMAVLKRAEEAERERDEAMQAHTDDLATIRERFAAEWRGLLNTEVARADHNRVVAEQAEAQRDALAEALREISLMGPSSVASDRPAKQWQAIALRALDALEPKP